MMDECIGLFATVHLDAVKDRWTLGAGFGQ